MISQRIVQKNNDAKMINQKNSTHAKEVLDHDKISEMRKLVHELDNNLSISCQQSSSDSSKEGRCDACIHTQPISTTDG